jgi:DNA topoisomerase-1
MPEPLRILAGDCTVTYEDAEETRRERGNTVTICKPDNTVLVHDASGYRPVAWLTRAAAVSCSRGDPPTVVAQDGDRRVRVEAHAEHAFERYPGSQAGPEVGECPACAGPLVRADGAVRCAHCGAEHGIPGDATVLEETCDCGRPRMRVERGAAFEVCVARDCESLDEAVRERFDRAWDCPDCEGDLRILRRGGLVAGCERYPDCDVGFGVPRGTVDGTCGCGLPVFDTPGGRRCLDTGCERSTDARARPATDGH